MLTVLQRYGKKMEIERKRLKKIRNSRVWAPDLLYMHRARATMRLLAVALTAVVSPAVAALTAHSAAQMHPPSLFFVS